MLCLSCGWYINDQKFRTVKFWTHSFQTQQEKISPTKALSEIENVRNFWLLMQFPKGSEPPLEFNTPIFKVFPSLIISQFPYFATFCRRDILRHFVVAKGCFFQTLGLQCLCIGIHLLAMKLKIVLNTFNIHYGWT